MSKTKIKGLPTFMTFFKGKEIERKTGSQTIQILEKMIENVIKIEKETSEQSSMSENEVIENTLRDLGYL